MGAHKPDETDMVRARYRERESLRMRIAGWAYNDIAEKLEMTPEGVRACVKRAMEKLAKVSDEDAEELRRIETERINAMLKGVWERAEQGDDDAINSAIKLQKRKAEMLGTDKKAEEQTGGDVVVNLVMKIEDRPTVTTVTVDRASTTVTQPHASDDDTGE